jgi:hypothetical protein
MQTTMVIVEGLELDVKFNYTPGREAKLDGPWETSYPAEDVEVEVLFVEVNGIDILDVLSENVLMQIETYIEENADDIVRN